MDELAGKIITGIVVAVLLFVLQSLGVHKLILGMIGGTSSPMLEEMINGDSKKEESYWASIDKCGTDECYQLYLDKYPQGDFASIAKVQLKGKKVNSSPISNNMPIVVKTPDQPKSNGKRIEHYIAYDNGTALDTKQDLLWMRCSLGQTWTGSDCSGKAKYFLWEKAKKQSITFAGYSNWRLPTSKELQGLVYCSNGKPDYFFMKEDDKVRGCLGQKSKDYKSPAILQSVFPHTEIGEGHIMIGYWSSSLYRDGARYIYFWNGNRSWRYTYSSAYVRLVRRGQ